jgi:hypothetical protein
MLVTVWQILNMKHVKWPETEILGICYNLHRKTREITLKRTYLWRVCAIWNHSVPCHPTRRRRRTLPCLASLFFRQTRSGSSLNILFVLCPRSSRVPRTHELARGARATALRCFHFCFCTKHCKQTPPRRAHSALCACFSGTTAKHKMYSVPVVASMYEQHRWLSWE